MKFCSLAFISLLLVFPAARRTAPFPETPTRETDLHDAQAIFAGGCFWGVEAAFRKTEGVLSTAAGYTGGHSESPTYRAVSSQKTGHAEAVHITFDPTKISYAELLDIFWECHDPSADPADSHRSVIFYFNHDQQITARASLAECQRRGFFARPMQTEIVPATRFYVAEDYHQHYFEKLGSDGRCEIGHHSVRTQLARDAARLRVSGALAE